MKLYRFTNNIAGFRPTLSAVFCFRDEADLLAMFPNATQIREATPLERAKWSIEQHNDRNISKIYGDSALSHVAMTYGQDEEYRAYHAYLVSLHKNTMESYA